jgi:surfactin synthase thioesterase subunit
MNMTTCMKKDMGYYFPIDDIGLSILTAWQSIRSDISWMTESCAHFSSDERDALYQALSGLVGKALPATFLQDYDTVALQTCHLRQLFAVDRNRPRYSLYGANRSSAPLCFIHPALFSAHMYYGLAHFLGGDHPLLALHSCHNEADFSKRRSGAKVLSQFSQRFVETILSVQPEGPFHVGGWCLGGLYAMEVARQLAELGHQVASISLIDPFFGANEAIYDCRAQFVTFRAQVKGHPFNDYFESFSAAQFFAETRRFRAFDFKVLYEFEFMPCDVPAIIIESSNLINPHREKIAEFFPHYAIESSGVEHLSMMLMANIKPIADIITHHIAEHTP